MNRLRPCSVSAAWILTKQPEIQRQVRDDPDLLGAFIEEALRYEPPFRGHYRHVVADTTLRRRGPARRFATAVVVGSRQPRSRQFEDPNEFPA